MATITLEDFRPAFNGWQTAAEDLCGYPARDGRWIPGMVADYRIIDTASAQRRYMNQSQVSFWLKSLLLVLGTPTISLVMNVAEGVFRALKVVTFANFWADREVDAGLEALRRPEQQLTIADFFPHLSIGVPALSRLQEKITRAWRPFFGYYAGPQHHFSYPFKARLRETADDLLFIALLIPTLAGRTLSALAGSTCGAFSLTCGRDAAKIYATFERLQGAGFILAPCFQPSATRHGLGGDINNPNAL
ncbi:MAG: hypothetical protein ACHQT8_05215 [Chlamydiales bacterium]